MNNANNGMALIWYEYNTYIGLESFKEVDCYAFKSSLLYPNIEIQLY